MGIAVIWSTAVGGGGSKPSCISSLWNGDAGGGMRVNADPAPTGGGSWPSCAARTGRSRSATTARDARHGPGPAVDRTVPGQLQGASLGAGGRGAPGSRPARGRPAARGPRCRPRPSAGRARGRWAAARWTATAASAARARPPGAGERRSAAGFEHQPSGTDTAACMSAVCTRQARASPHAGRHLTARSRSPGMGPARLNKMRHRDNKRALCKHQQTA